MLTGSSTYLIVIVWGLWILTGNRLFADSKGRVVMSMVFVFYVSRLLAITLFPLPIDAELIQQRQMLSDAGLGASNNFTLFATVQAALGTELSFIEQIVGNFLLLTPLGFFAPLLWERFRSVKRGLALVVSATLAIEFSQLGISRLVGFTYRSFDVDDLWLNALGGSVAVVLAMFVSNAMASPTEPIVAPSLKGSLETVPCRSGLG